MNEQEKIKITGYTGSKGKEYLVLHIKKFNLLMKNFISDRLNFFQKFGIILDFSLCVVKYGAGINDYFQYNFYKRRSVDRNTFIVGRKWKKIIKCCNGKIKQEIFDNKSKFNQQYSEFLGRAWLDIDQCTYDEFEDFISKYKQVISKIKNGSGGNGIEIINYKEGLLSQYYKELKKKHVMLEEIIKQHESMKRFNPESVNTLRIVTIVDKSNTVKIMNAVFRAGNGEKCTDNFHHHGLAALVDEQTGIVITPAIDKSNVTYYVHPRTKCQIIGYQIPFWEKIIETVKQAALVNPQVRYVGWDIALTEKGDISIIEGNCASDPDIVQMPDQIGKWPKYKKVLDEFES